MKKSIKTLGLLVAIGFFLVGCSSSDAKDDKQKIVKIGIVGADDEVLKSVKERLMEEGIDLQLVMFSEFTQPNAALVDKEIDLNAFQHQLFLDNYNAEHATNLVSIGNTLNAPLGMYSEKVSDVKEIKKGAEIAIPNDTTNGGRALLLLQSAGLIKVDASKGQTPTVSDITENKLNLAITELDASQTARSLQDVEVSVINNQMAVDAGLSPLEDTIFLEPVDETSKPYVNIIVARKEDEDNATYNKVVDVYQQEETKKVIEETSKGARIPAWESFGKK